MPRTSSLVRSYCACSRALVSSSVGYMTCLRKLVAPWHETIYGGGRECSHYERSAPDRLAPGPGTRMTKPQGQDGEKRPDRIDVTDTPANAVFKLVEGDQAAAEACIALVKAVATADPKAE